MTQVGDKKSGPETKIPGNSPVAESGLPDTQSIDSPADMFPGDEPTPFPIVGIGTSAGGVEALQKLFQTLPADRGIAYIVVIHLSANHPSHLTEILATKTSMPVVQPAGDMLVEPDRVYIIPPNCYLSFDRGYLRLEQIPLPRSVKAIDHLFISLAKAHREAAICIVLTGSDQDGTVGLEAIKAAGGMAMAQAPGTAQHPDMPESAVNSGLVDYVLPIEEMGKTLVQYLDDSPVWQFETPAKPSEKEIRALKEIIALLCAREGGDFRGYKEGMLMRRSKRRMALQGLTDLNAYAAYLRETPSEILTLGADFLIKVTEFFREPQAWQALEEQVLPEIIANHHPGQPLRVWVAGCATHRRRSL